MVAALRFLHECITSLALLPLFRFSELQHGSLFGVLAAWSFVGFLAAAHTRVQSTSPAPRFVVSDLLRTNEEAATMTVDRAHCCSLDDLVLVFDVFVNADPARQQSQGEFVAAASGREAFNGVMKADVEKSRETRGTVEMQLTVQPDQVVTSVTGGASLDVNSRHSWLS